MRVQTFFTINKNKKLKTLNSITITLFNMTTLALRPTIYYPTESGSGFKDDISGISATMFQDPGVKCSCGSKTIFKNKYSFTHQHLKSSQHQNYINNWSKRGSSNLIETCIHLKKETRAQQIIIAEKDKTVRTLRRQKEILQPENARLKEELEATKAQFEELLYQLQEENGLFKRKNIRLTDSISELEKNVEEMSESSKKGEDLAKHVLNSLGYDFES